MENNTFADRNYDWFEIKNGSGGFEFDQFFTKKKLNDGSYGYRVKSEALKQCDIFFANLPNCFKAIDILQKTTVNKGLKLIKGSGPKDEVSEQDLEILKQFKKTLLPKPLEFLYDVIRLKQTKGNLLLHLAKKDNGQYVWIVIEPERFSVVSSSENEVLSKYDIKGFLLHKKGKTTEDLDINFTLFVRSSPASILGVPPLLFNHLYSKLIVADIKKNHQINETGAFKKTLMTAKKIESKNGEIAYRALSDVEFQDFSNAVKICQRDPNKSIQVTDIEPTVTPLPALEVDPEFHTKYDVSYTLHTASLTGVAPYRLLPPDNINRATAQEQYSEMIEAVIQPLNNSLSELIQEMFDIWYFLVLGKENTKIQVTIDNPKSVLDISVTGKDLSLMEINKQIKTNELRERMSLESYSEDEQKERDDLRLKIPLKQPKIKDD